MVEMISQQLIGGLEYKIKSSELKIRENILPYITYPLTEICNSKCVFCGEGGELTDKGQLKYFPLEILIDRSLIAIQKGIKKFRLTGGEPLVHPQIGNVLKFFSDNKVYVLLNTNGRLIMRNKEDFTELNDNIHVAVSLHTTNQNAYDKITGTTNQFKKVISGIEFLAEIGNLERLNMVVTKYNQDNILDMITYCKELNCGLKIHEIVDVPIPFGERDSYLVPIMPVEQEIAKIAEKKLPHEYSESFGIPCRRYVVNGVTINVKSLGHGTRYDFTGLCNNCTHYPCHEGLYDCYILPDGNVLPCRWGEKLTSLSFSDQLDKAISIFQNAEYHERNLKEQKIHFKI